MLRSKEERLSKREQQIMDIIYETGECSANDVHERLPDPPSYSAVRAMLKLLLEKNILQHKQEGQKYIYYPRVNRDQAKKSALNDILKTFFQGSAQDAVATLINMKKESMSDEDLDKMSDLIEKAKQEGR